MNPFDSYMLNKVRRERGKTAAEIIWRKGMRI